MQASVEEQSTITLATFFVTCRSAQLNMKNARFSFGRICAGMSDHQHVATCGRFLLAHLSIVKNIEVVVCLALE
jgi:hypothetical protein